MAISTYKTYLCKKDSSSSNIKKLIDIKDFPDLGGPPEMLETTTLSDSMQTFIAGIQKLDAMPFTCNYTPEDYQKLKALEGKDEEYAVVFSTVDYNVPDASVVSFLNGKFTFKGQLSVYVSGKGVNEVVEMIVTISPSSEIKFATA